jgi:hypothetical protein
MNEGTKVRAFIIVVTLGLLLLFERWVDGHRRRAEEAAAIRARMERIRRGGAS